VLRFTIRDVLWLTVVVALACGWGITGLGKSLRGPDEYDSLRDAYSAALIQEGFVIKDNGNHVRIEKAGGRSYVFGIK